MRVVSRSVLPEIHTAVVDGVEHSLGTVKLFSSSQDLADFFQDKGTTAMSWVRLARDEELAAHRHAEPSLIIVTEGTGEVFGEVQQLINAGDMVLVPAGKLHGFRAVGAGFWALSIQFNGSALYQDPDAPKVAFEALSTSVAVDRLLARNAEHVESYRQSSIMRLMEEDAIKDAAVREVLLDCLQIWSDSFQLLLHLRFALTEDSNHKRVALEHLSEEMGHNENLRAQRDNATTHRWDATMQSAMAWFKHAMLTGSDIERTLLMHLVLESSGEVFHAAAAPVFGHMDHFREHGEDDGAHAEYGVQLLKSASTSQLEGLDRILENGWKMMTVLCNRMADMARSAKYDTAAPATH
jgi:quercetin dioxygenase-like cupin family protein